MACIYQGLGYKQFWCINVYIQIFKGCNFCGFCGQLAICEILLEKFWRVYQLKSRMDLCFRMATQLRLTLAKR